MKVRYCKCGNEMLSIKKDCAWYWCGRCGRFLNGAQLLDPGDEWLEPLTLKDEKFNIKEIEEKTKWISVKDRLPDQGHPVLVFSKKHGRDIGYFDNGKFVCCSLNLHYSNIEVLYWMPLPDSPEVKND